MSDTAIAVIGAILAFHWSATLAIVVTLFRMHSRIARLEARTEVLWNGRDKHD